jgi:hypothetical protein
VRPVAMTDSSEGPYFLFSRSISAMRSSTSMRRDGEALSHWHMS